MSEKKDVLHVGIDLGTSRSAIAASNGQHHVVESYVGREGQAYFTNAVTEITCGPDSHIDHCRLDTAGDDGSGIKQGAVPVKGN